ncbi:MAG TPA: SH3 domain-containing protein [Candidatus Binatia bacterium]|nr:SH3 domain-containing protein [Candidatus Binatia bacterium]
MRAAALAVAVVAAFVGVMYLRFASDSVPGPPPGAVAGGPQCVVFRNVSGGDENEPQATCGPTLESRVAPVSTVWAGSIGKPTPAAPPDSVRGVKVLPLEMGAPTEMPPYVALIVQTCMGECGNTPGIARVYRDSQGNARTDPLVSLPSLGLSPKSSSDPTGAYFTGFAADPDGSALAVSVCVHGSCAFAGNGAELGAESAIFRSLDGGVTWSELDRQVGIAWVIGMSPGREALVANVVNDGQVTLGGDVVAGVTRIGYKALPGGEELLPPVESGYTQPFLAPDGDALWHTDDGAVVRMDGTQWLGAWADPRNPQVALQWSYTFDSTGNHGLVTGIAVNPMGSGANLLLIVRRDGSLELAFSTPTFIVGPIWLDETHLLSTIPWNSGLPRSGTTNRGYLPVLIDLGAGLIHPISHPSTDSPSVGINGIIAVQQGPFARVVHTDNTCLNVRAEPLPSAGILDCAAEGVLLRDLGQATDFAGSNWLQVATPAGAEGWASAQYLER